MKEKETPKLPFALAFTDAKRDLVAAVNTTYQKYGIPYFLLEEIVLDILHQVKDFSAAERENARAAYERELEEFEKPNSPC